MHVTLRQLQVFEAAARHLSFTRAAEELHLTQPAVSMQIKQLERAVALPLFEQVGKKLYLTHAGEVLLGHGQRIGRCLREIDEDLGTLRGVDGGRLRIGVVSTVNYFATRILSAFTRAHPAVRITLAVGNRREIMASLDENSGDIVLMGEPPAGLDVEAMPFMDNPLVVIAPVGSPLAGRRLSVAELDGVDFVVREDGSGTRATTERFFQRRGVSPGRTMELTGNEAIKQAVEAGIGLAVVSRHTVELETAAGRLTELSVEGFPIHRQWYLVHRRGKQLSPPAAAFRAFLLHRTGAEAPVNGATAPNSP